jgi:hypothetical protein
VRRAAGGERLELYGLLLVFTARIFFAKSTAKDRKPTVGVEGQMDQFRVALMVTRIIGASLSAVGTGWLLAWGSLAANDWVFAGTLAPQRPSYRLLWITYAGVYAVGGVILSLFARQIAKFATRP